MKFKCIYICFKIDIYIIPGEKPGAFHSFDILNDMFFAQYELDQGKKYFQNYTLPDKCNGYRV